MQRFPMRHRRHQDGAVVFEADEATIEQMIHIRRQQQPVITVQALDIARITPRFAVARAQVFDQIHLCDATEGLDTLDVLFEQALPPARHDDCMPSGFGRSEEHTSALKSLMRTSYAVSCLKKQ